MKALREAAVFLGAMAALAFAVFAAFWLIIRGGGVLLRTWFHLFAFLPRPAALALAVFATALTVYGAWYWLAERRRKARIAA